MAQKRWYAFSGLLQRVLTESTEVVGTAIQVFRFGRPVRTFETFAEAMTYVDAQPFPNQFQIREVEVTIDQPAATKGVALVPLTPLPVFTRPGKVLTTRGFWDVQSVTVPRGNVSNFAFGMCFLPVKSVYDQVPVEQGRAIRYDLISDAFVPDPLLDDVGWFAYDSFVRVTTDVNQDPPFHSKSQKKFPAGSVLCVVAGVEVGVDSLQSLRLDFGIRFRILIED